MCDTGSRRWLQGQRLAVYQFRQWQRVRTSPMLRCSRMLWLFFQACCAAVPVATAACGACAWLRCYQRLRFSFHRGFRSAHGRVRTCRRRRGPQRESHSLRSPAATLAIVTVPQCHPSHPPGCSVPMSCARASTSRHLQRLRTRARTPPRTRRLSQGRAARWSPTPRRRLP